MSNAGFATRISYKSVVNFKLATGITKLERKKEKQHKSAATKNKGRIKRNNGIPADLIATNSKLSPKFPKVIMDEIKTANGNANVIIVTVT